MTVPPQYISKDGISIPPIWLQGSKGRLKWCQDSSVVRGHVSFFVIISVNLLSFG